MNDRPSNFFLTLVLCTEPFAAAVVCERQDQCRKFGHTGSYGVRAVLADFLVVIQLFYREHFVINAHLFGLIVKNGI